MVTFRHFRAYRYDHMSRIDVNSYARKVGLFLLHVTITLGLWSRFDVFVCTYLTICHGHMYVRLQG